MFILLIVILINSQCPGMARSGVLFSVIVNTQEVVFSVRVRTQEVVISV